MSEGVPLQKLQRRVIRVNLELGEDDRTKVSNRLVLAARRQEMRIVMLAIVKFEDGEVRVISDMQDFVNSFERVRFGSGPSQISNDDFSIAMLGASGEEAYKQLKRLADFLSETHHGWYLTKQDAVATYKKPRNFWKLLANAFESYDKKFVDYRLIVDLGKTADIRKESRLVHERYLLYGNNSRTASDTMASASSSIFSRGGSEKTVEARAAESASARSRAKAVSVSEVPNAASVSEAPNATSEGGSSSSSSSDEGTLETSAKEFQKEVEEAVKLKKQLSSSSLSSSSSKIAYKLPKKKKKKKDE